MENVTHTTRMPSIQEFFAPGGVLASSVPFKLEDRPGQLKMAQAVGQVISETKHLIVEAGTGTGKTMAYLYPALRHALMAEQRIIVSTGTKQLQEQIFYKDIPMLQKAIGEFNVCYLKGRANYLCIDKFNHVRPGTLPSDEVREFNIIDNWQSKTESGDRAELSSLPENSSLWKRINAKGDACTGKKCSKYDDCFVNLARQDAEAAHVVIVNHHLFFADLVVRMKNPHANILPDADVVIFDEAHELETVASEAFGVSASNRRIADLSGDIQRTLVGRPELSEIITSLDELTQRFSDLCLMLPIENKVERIFFADRHEWLKKYGALYKGVLTALEKVRYGLKLVKGSDDSELLVNRTEALVGELRYLFESEDSITVVWLERRAALKPGTFNTHITATPIEVSELLRASLFGVHDSVILCSATLAVQNKFEHLKKTLGIDEAKELIVSSPFQYKRQAALYLPPDMIDPRKDGAFENARKAAEEILNVSQGRAFFLFTSYENMTRMYAALEKTLAFPMLLHGGGIPRKELLDTFRKTPNAVLFGTSSFWQGVDVQGEQLSCVIIDRLPFSVPSDPIVMARTKAIEKAGGNGFSDYQIPHAVIALKQGFGRLIRSTSDLGILAILDPRIEHPRYGRMFTGSLPDYTITSDLKVAAEFVKPRSQKQK
jgi:ATP-dependent DNA helicase DinG